MDPYNIIKLKLLAPLVYAKNQSTDPGADDSASFLPGPEAECIFFFTLNEEAGAHIDPDPAHYLGKPVFCGCTENKPGQQADQVAIPAGDYFFAQQRKTLGREEFIRMAIEVQREILWQRLEPLPGLYVRRLFEDGSPVTQIFRPVAGNF
jgi:hypothetical protein